MDKLPQLVMDIAMAFGKVGQVMTPRRIYDKIPAQGRPYFPTFRDTILPDLEKRGLIKKSRVSKEHVVYELLGVNNMPETKGENDEQS